MARRVPRTRYAQSAGAKIAYQASGQGGCDLVFVPGLVSHLDLQWQQLGYRRFVSALERVCRVIRFDKRGTGLSDPTDALPSMDQRVADLAAVMDAAGAEPVAQAVADFVGDVAASGTVAAAPARTGPPRAAPPRREPPRTRPVGWPAVTEGEWRVVALAAQGHTNAEIAGLLFLSRYTVETHLKHVFAKLGLRSRAELAAVAAAAARPPDT